MNPSSVNAYVPEALYRLGKEQPPCRRFYEDLAVVLPADRFRILAARGTHLKAGEHLTLAERDLSFWEENRTLYPRLLAEHEGLPLILFGDWYASCGLLLVLLPHESLSTAITALPHISHSKTAIAPSVRKKQPSPASSAAVSAYYPILAEQYALCDRILNAEEDFRLHAAHIAEYAGCLAKVTDLPIGEFPLSRHTQSRWSAFLMCLFLALRGDSAIPSALSLSSADTKEFHLQLLHEPQARRRIPIEQTLFSFLELPCFSDFSLSKTERGLLLEAALPRRTAELALHADPIWEILCLEILFAAANS